MHEYSRFLSTFLRITSTICPSFLSSIHLHQRLINLSWSWKCLLKMFTYSKDNLLKTTPRLLEKSIHCRWLHLIIFCQGAFRQFATLHMSIDNWCHMVFDVTIATFRMTLLMNKWIHTIMDNGISWSMTITAKLEIYNPPKNYKKWQYFWVSI
jgi:hypothetical protein